MVYLTDAVESLDIDGGNADILGKTSVVKVHSDKCSDDSDLSFSQATSAAHLYLDVTSRHLNICPATTSRNLTCTDFSFASDQFPILFFEECTTPITDGSQILMGLFHDIDGGLDWGVKGDECHTHSSGNLFNVHSYLGFILCLAAQCCSMMIKKRFFKQF